MKNESGNRLAVYTMVSFFIYVVSCYIAFSETWSVGAMKLFMAVIVAAAAFSIYFCSKLSTASSEQERASAPLPKLSEARS